MENGLPVPRPVAVDAPAPDPEPGVPPARAAARGAGRAHRRGKDSMVLIEAVRPLAPRLLAVDPHPLVPELADQAGLELLVVRRQLSPNLAGLNRSGALNGHVPITAIVSLIAVLGSAIYGYDTIAMAVERSASEESVRVDGIPVNHQYSKSLAFERLLAELVTASIDPGLTYGSALRPYSELAIARAFAPLTDYHATFCSCNAAFRQSAGAEDRWCGECAKCRFVGLMLAPSMAPEDLTALIGRDMFADRDQIAGFAALMSDRRQAVRVRGGAPRVGRGHADAVRAPGMEGLAGGEPPARTARAVASDARRRGAADRRSIAPLSPTGCGRRGRRGSWPRSA